METRNTTLYITPLEKALEQAERGFDLSHRVVGAWQTQKVPPLMSADDLALLARSSASSVKKEECVW